MNVARWQDAIADALLTFRSSRRLTAGRGASREDALRIVGEYEIVFNNEIAIDHFSPSTIGMRSCGQPKGT